MKRLKPINYLRALVVGMGVFIACTGFTSSAHAAKQCKMGDVNDPIIISTIDWSSYNVLANVYGQLLKKIGYSVQYKTSNANTIFEAVRQGQKHVAVEVWESSQGKRYSAALAKGGIIDAGAYPDGAWEGWWVPNFTIKMCPGLPDYKALKKCYQLFVQPDSKGRAVILDGPQSWNTGNPRFTAALKKLGSHFTIKHASSANALWKALAKAKAQNKAIIVYNWTPNFTDEIYGGAMIKFPKDGTNYLPTGGYLKKAAWEKMPQKWPCAYRILENLTLNNKQIGRMAAMVDIAKLSTKAAASRWIKENHHVWSRWTRPTKD